MCFKSKRDFPQSFLPSLSRKERRFATNQMEFLEVPNRIVDFRFCKKFVAYEWRRRLLRPRTRLSPPGQHYTCACPPSINSIPLNQLEVIRQYAASHNMEIVQAHSDHGRSGLNIAGREGLNQLMSEVENKQANSSALLVYDVSRRGRFQDVDESLLRVCPQEGRHAKRKAQARASTEAGLHRRRCFQNEGLFRMKTQQCFRICTAWLALQRPKATYANRAP